MTVSRAAAALTGLILAGVACSGPASEAGWTVSTDTLPGGGVRVVNTPPSGGQPGWTLEETLRVGSVLGDGPDSFADLRGLVVFPDGGFAVLDATAQEVRVFDPSGAHVETHGRKGGGPGELQAAFGLMLHPDGSLWVPDHRNARMSVFDPREGFRESFPLRLLRRGFVWRGTMMRDSRIWKPSLILEPWTNVMRVYGEGMTLVDSLPLPDDPEYDGDEPPGAFVWRSPDGSSRASFSVPFYPSGQNLIDPRGRVWSTAYGDPSYRIARWTPGGDTTLVLETRRPLIEIPGPVRDSAIAQIREQMLQFGSARQDWSKVPTIRPSVHTMFLSESGDLWVRSVREDHEVFDVYDQEGRHLRSVLNPFDLFRWLRPTVRGDDLWGVVTDELDVQYVVRASVVPRED